MTRAAICVVGGAGHVGLPLAITFASRGVRVIIHDVDRVAMDAIRTGRMPFQEKGAEPLLAAALAANLLELTDDPTCVSRADTVIIVIGTPVDEFLNPSWYTMTRCLDALAPHLVDGQLLVLRSTVYPGVTQQVFQYLAARGKTLRVAFCPERVVQGRAIEEIQTLPQVVAGVDAESEDAAARVFEAVAPELVRMQPTEAELVKLFSNAYRYIQFAVSNQFFLMCHQAGVDYYRVIEGMKHNYPRMADVPRAGFAAGPCLFKDTMQLVAFYRNQFNLGMSAMLVNESMPMFIADQLGREHDLGKLTVGLLGMAFKADSDDPRSSLSYKLKKLLSLRAKRVLTTDPHVAVDPELSPLADVIAGSDILVLCVPHAAYRGMDFGDKQVLDIWGSRTGAPGATAPGAP